MAGEWDVVGEDNSGLEKSGGGSEWDVAGETVTDVKAATKQYEKEHGALGRLGLRLKGGFEDLESSAYMQDAVNAADRARGAASQAEAIEHPDPTSPLFRGGKSAISGAPGEVADAAGRPLMWKDQNAEAMRSIAGTAKKDLGTAVEGYMEHSQKAAAVPRAPVVDAAAKATTFMEAWDAIKQAPVSYIAESGVRSLPLMVQPLAEGVVGGATGGPAGFMAGTGHGSAAIDYAAELGSALQDAGVDTTDKNAVMAALLDPQTVAQMKARAGVHSKVVGLFDALSAGLASKTLAPKVVTNKVARELTNIALQTPVQGALGAAGEAGGELAQGKDLSPNDILAEAAGEMVGAPADIAGAAVSGVREHVAHPVKKVDPAVDPVGSAIEDANAVVDAAAAPTVLALPAPSIVVDSGGVAATEAQRAAESLRRAELGLTPDVERAAEQRAASGFLEQAGGQEQAIPYTPAELPQAGEEAYRYEGAIPYEKPRADLTTSLGAAAETAPVEAGIPFVSAPDLSVETARDASRRVVRDERIAEQQARMGAVALPDGLSDPRLKRQDYRQALNKMGQQLIKGGDITLVPKEGAVRRADTGDLMYDYGADQLVRTASANPDWFKALGEDASTSMPVEDVRKAITKALAGGKLGVREQRVISAMLDAHKGERTSGTNIDYAKAQMEAARQARRDAGKPEADTAGEWYSEDSYDHQDNAEARILADVYREAQAIDPDRAEAIMERMAIQGAGHLEIANALDGIITGEQHEEAQQGRLAHSGAGEGEAVQGYRGPEAERAGGGVPGAEGAHTEDLGTRFEASQVDRRGGFAPVAQEQRQGDRRSHGKARALYEKMSREDLIRELLHHELTGIKNKRAFVVEVEDAAHVISVDADSLKWVNDNMSPDSGDRLLQITAKALVEEFGYDRSYHTSGDEFYVLLEHGVDLVEVMKAMERVEARVKAAVIKVDKLDGSTVTVTGITATPGYGKTKEEADYALKNEKRAREAAGQRAGRGEQPAGAVITPAPAREHGDIGNAPPAAAPDIRGETSAEVTPQQTPAPAGVSVSEVDEKKASAVLDRSGVKGKERLDIISKVRAGEYSLKDLEEAYPAQESSPETQGSASETQGLQDETQGFDLAEAASDALAQADAVEPVSPSVPVEPITSKQALQAAGQETKIGDFGKRDVLVRKDYAKPTGPRMAKAVDERPAWARQFVVLQIKATPGRIGQTNIGKWQIMRQVQGMRGAVKAVGKFVFETEQEALDTIPAVAVSLKHRVYSYDVRKPTEAEAKASSEAADAWLKEVSEGVAKLRADNEALLLSASVTRKFKKALASGQISQETFDGAIKKGTVISDARMAEAEAVERKIDDLREKPMDSPNAVEKRWGIYRNITDRKRAMVKGDFASQDEAMRYLATHPVEIIEHKFPFPERPWLDNIERIGAIRRSRDVTKEMFEQTFSPGKVVYGEWLLNKDGTVNSDGQELSNHAYDALMDLADILNVPPKALFLDGELALGLGADGKGGKDAARAHYSPDKALINLTKLKGAGTLAHELWHAMDHYFAKNGGYADSDSVIAGGYSSRSTARPELIEAMKRVVESMNYTKRSSTTDADVIRQRAQKRIDEAQKTFDYHMGDLRGYLRTNEYGSGKKKGKGATTAQLAKWDELSARLRDGDMGDEVYIENPSKLRGAFGFKTGDVIRDLNDIYKAVTGRSFLRQDPESRGRQIHWIVKSIADNKGHLDAKEDLTEERKGRTDYYIEARRIDGYRASDYWSTPEEMGARAFESYIFDRLTGDQKRSDYLVYAVENRYYARMDMKPYPEGDERTAINKAFDNLFQAIQTKETDKGVAMFARRGRAGSDRTPWAGFPAVAIARELGTLNKHPDYPAAKAGDTEAAYRLVKDSLTDDAVETIRSALAGKKPTVVAVHAEESAGRNKIPLLYAEVLADRLGLKTDTDVVQTVRAKHTASKAFHRIGIQPVFGGHVTPGQDYLIVDDAVTIGGTLANLRGHIEANGGNVVLASTLTGHSNGATIALKPETLQKLRQKHGDALESWWQDEFGFGLDHLTEGEAGHLLKAPSVDAIRDRIAEARRQAGIGEGEGTDSSGQGPLTPSAARASTRQIPEESVYRSQRPAAGMLAEAVREAIAPIVLTWGDNAPQVEVVQSETALPRHLQHQIGEGGEVQGIHDPSSGTVYLVADALGGKNDALRILAHEAVGHYGLEEVLGDQFQKAVDRVKWLLRTGNKKVKALAASVEEAYPGVDENTRAREILAHLAEERGFGGVFKDTIAKIRAAVRDFLRRIGFKVPWSEAEIDAMLARAARYLRESGEKRQTIPEALEHPQLGDIDVAIGRGRTGASMFGAEYPDIAAHLEDLVAGAELVDETHTRATLQNGDTRFDLVKKNGRWTLTGARADFARSGSHPDNGQMTNTEEFRRWFGDSVVTNNGKPMREGGRPMAVYHGTNASPFEKFGVPAFFTSDRKGAQWFARGEGGRVEQVFLSIKNPLDISTQRGAFRLISLAREAGAKIESNIADDGLPWDFFSPDIEKHSEYEGTNVADLAYIPAVREKLESVGYDGLRVSDTLENTEIPVFVAFRPEQVKSAIGRINFARKHVTGNSGRTYTSEQEAAFENTGRTVEVKSWKERAEEWRQNWQMKLRQGIADQFAPIADLDPHAYTLARLSKGSDGALEAFMLHGQLKLEDGVYDADMSGGVVEKLLRPLKGEMDDFMWWVAANRAERLAGEGREHLFTPEDIAAYKSLDKGVAEFDYTLQHNTGPYKAGTVTRDRTIIYRDAAKTLEEMNRNVMDIAEQSGLIDGESRGAWEKEFYIPFYRAMEDGVGGPNIKAGLVRQYAFKQLKGGSGKLNADLLGNTIQNWAHLIAASAKNRAAAATLTAAERVGAAHAIPGSEKGSVFYREQGVEKHFLVDDPFLMEAVTALDYNGMTGPAMKVMGKFKHYLTVGVTANPTFKIRNLIRDSISAIGVSSDLEANPLKNLKQGYKATSKESQTYVSMLASGGLVKFGLMLEGNRANHVRQLVEEGVDAATILDSESKVKAFWRRHIKPAIDAYNELGDRGESINRAALYQQLIANGMPHAEASLAARDLLDFSMGGTWQAVRFLTQTVPFMNARIQGIYKLGRSDKKRLGYVIGAVTLASLALLAAYQDDDDWKKREDWDRETYWWFKFGGIAFRIPKPFEIGAVASVAEHMAEYLSDEEMDGERFVDRLGQIVGSQLSMNPIPQLFKPMLSVYSNKDDFTGRPIETMGMDRLRPEDRYTSKTSEVARALGQAGLLSPVQIDYLIRGYFGWLGTAASTSVDYLARATIADRPPAPSMQLRDVFLAGNFMETLPSNSSRYVTAMYEQSKEIEEAYASFQSYRKMGNGEKVREILEEDRDKLIQYKRLEAVKRQESEINQRIRLIEAREDMDGDAKREALTRLYALRDRVARKVTARSGAAGSD